MREIAILMTPEMSRATRLDMKSETRRLVGLEQINQAPDSWNYKGKLSWHAANVVCQFKNIETQQIVDVICPYGKVDNLLWVRETWNKDGYGDFRYKADFPDDQVMRWRPNIHMHKVAARTWLQIESIGIERLHDVSKESAIEEGIDLFLEGGVYRIPSRVRGVKHTTTCPAKAYIYYVNYINKITDDFNPWVWVIRFYVMSKTGKPTFKGKEIAHV